MLRSLKLIYFNLILGSILMVALFQNCGAGFTQSSSLSLKAGGTAQGLPSDPSNPSFALGRKIYTSKCQGCHGDYGSSTIRGATKDRIEFSFQNIEAMRPFKFHLVYKNMEEIEALEAYLALSLSLEAEACGDTTRDSEIAMLTPVELSNILVDPGIFALKPNQLGPLELPEPTGGGGTVFNNDSDLQQIRGLLVRYFEASYSIADLSVKARYNSSICQTNEKPILCAERVLGLLAFRAFRRPLQGEDFKALLASYSAAANFDAGMREAIRLILVDPKFLFKTKIKGRNTAFEIASRLSFGLLGSSPDPILLAKATDGSLLNNSVLEAEVDRLLKDPRAAHYEKEFAHQWLELEQLRDSNDPTNGAALTETELLFKNIRTNGAPVRDIIGAKYSFLNNRLAKLYGIPGVNGDPVFKKVDLPSKSQRQGVLGHASFLKVSSVAARTSPVLRGHWVRNKFLCLDVGPADGDIPPLNETNLSELSIRDAMAKHSDSSTSCYSCHSKMDHYGWPLEYFDKEGAYRTIYEVGGFPVDGRADLAEIGGGNVESPLEYISELDSALTVKACVVERQMQFMINRSLVENEKCHARNIARRVVIPSGTYADMIKAIVTSSVFKGQ